ncbi:hypothetical protein P692DRAFT_201791369 [Suillus brevipes Sb2]|nr:hypothetical protein P692DRAFT_201791369 [Suillus brevipes Sb2]
MPPGKSVTATGAGPPKSHSPSPPIALNTRRTVRNPTSADDILAMPNDVMNATDAEKYLTTKLLCLEGQPFTLQHLSSILFHITQMSAVTPAPVTAATRAVAILLRKHVVCEIAEAAAKTISSTLTDSLATRLVDHTIAALAPQIASIHVASEALAKTAQLADNTLSTTLDKAEKLHRLASHEREEHEGGLNVAAERLEETADALYATVTDCQNAITLLAPSLDSTQERINLLSKQMTTPPITSPAVPLTYSAVTAAHLPPSVDHPIGRAAIRACQIVLDPKPGTTLFPPGTSHKDMAARLKEAIGNIRDDNTPSGYVWAVTTLHNGGLIAEMNTEELAVWLRSPLGRSLLEGQFDSTVSFRTRTFATVIEYLPIRLQIEDTSFLRNIESENSLPEESLTSIRWIKPPARRSSEQRKAFAIVQVADAHTANNLLRDGICIENERFVVRKDKKEPIRCAKCQSYGHIARNCSAPADLCGTCAGQHSTLHCNAYRTTRCVNSRTDNHTSWSRKCPEFIRRCELLNEKFPENRMPYFPTEAAWTHAISPSRPHKLPSHNRASTPPRSQQAGPSQRLQQTTISFPHPPPSSPSILPTPHTNTAKPLPTADEIMADLYPPLDFNSPSDQLASTPSASSDFFTPAPSPSPPSSHSPSSSSSSSSHV